jgi:hypothetical protein
MLSVAEIVFSAVTLYPIALVAMFFVGIGAIAMAATANSLVQVTVPGPLRGRVMSVYTTVFSGSTPIGSGFTGGVAATLGTPVSVFMDGALALVVTVVAAIAVLQGRVVGIGKGRGGGADAPTTAPVREPIGG